MHINEYVATQLHKMREVEARAQIHPNRTIAEYILQQKQEIMRSRKKHQR
jgi:hypothetical protein